MLSTEEVDLRDLVLRVVDAHARFAETTGTQIQIHANRPCKAEVDARRIERILRNLLVNAIEHGEGRPIDIFVEGDDAAVAIAVRDHGVGFEAVQSKQVFHRFWRGDPARARTVGGTGLGLAISMEDANLHGGWLTAWGRPGMGAQFRLTLPRKAGTILEASPLPMVPRDLVGPDGVRLEARDMPPASPEASIAGIRSELVASDGSIVHGLADEDSTPGSAATSTPPLTSVVGSDVQGASEAASGRR